MTGEISLRGRVLPVGGIKEKILAAVSHGMRLVIIPNQNKKDLEEVPADLLGRIEVKTVERIEEIWPLACAPRAGKAKAAKAAPAKKAAAAKQSVATARPAPKKAPAKKPAAKKPAAKKK
jgi:ATP-dependent Lon protease